MARVSTQKITPFLWFETNGPEGAEYYIIPEALITWSSGPNLEKARKVVDAMMKMRKIIVAELEATYNN